MNIHYDLEAERARLKAATAAMFAQGEASAPASEKTFVHAQKVLAMAGIDLYIARLQIINEGLPSQDIARACAVACGTIMRNMLWNDRAPDLSMGLVAMAANLAFKGPDASCSHSEKFVLHGQTGGRA